MANSQRAYVSPSAIHRKYWENVSSGQSKETGWLYGFQSGYDLIESHFFYFGADLQNYWGKTRYLGSLQNPITGVIVPFHSHTDNWMIMAEGRMGYTAYASGIKFVPFFGFGYYQWNREPTNRSYGYDETYRWLYYTAGFRLQARLCPRIKIGLFAKAMYTQNAWIEVSELFPYPVKAKLGNTFQYEAELPITIRWRNHFDTSFVATGAYREIGASQRQRVGATTFSEPSSQAIELGARLELGYLF